MKTINTGETSPVSGTATVEVNHVGRKSSVGLSSALPEDRYGMDTQRVYHCKHNPWLSWLGVSGGWGVRVGLEVKEQP